MNLKPTTTFKESQCMGVGIKVGEIRGRIKVLEELEKRTKKLLHQMIENKIETEKDCNDTDFERGYIASFEDMLKEIKEMKNKK